MPVAKLALEDGTVVAGQAFGACPAERAGELVFNTSMSGYQEILTDPSYKGQIVLMTYPLIGNYGVTPEDDESAGPQVEAFVIRELSARTSNFRAVEGLDAYLKRHGIPGIQGVDTRALTRRIREGGALRAVISSKDLDDASLVRKAKASPRLDDVDLVGQVTTPKPYDWTRGFESAQAGDVAKAKGRRPYRVAAIDYGVKRNILRHLVHQGCEVKVFPATAGADEVLKVNPDGIFLSNGPGDPARNVKAIETVRQLMAKRLPIFGICLGHQILGLAMGGKTFKLKFGHRGGNQPVQDLRTGKVEVTSQNHGYAVDIDSLPKGEVETTHVNLNDRTLEGFRHKKLPVYSVQYHPEASPGPHDSGYLFRDFIALMDASAPSRS